MQDSFIVPVCHRVFHFLPGTLHENPSTYGTEQVLQTAENVIFMELTVPLTFVCFHISNTVRFGNEIHDHLVAFMKRADHTAPGFTSPITNPSARALAPAQAGTAPAWPWLLPGQQDMAGGCQAKP